MSNRTQTNISISKDIKKQVAILSVEHEIRNNKCYEILLQYALDHIDEVKF